MNWQAFLDARRIRYATTGPNVARDHIAIQCPWCGAADPSEHLGISLRGRGWACWRNKAHRGKSNAFLITALIGCSMEEAHRIAGTGSVHVPDDFMGRMEGLLRPPGPAASRPFSLYLRDEFKSFDTALPSRKLYVDYLIRRGFSESEIRQFTERYGVHYCTRGVYRNRVIFPVYYHDELVTWTGRSIFPDERLRYKTLSPDHAIAGTEGYLPALSQITNYLLWYDDLMDDPCDDTIYICEGPFDALKVRVLGRPDGVTATCLFTSNISEQQIGLLHNLLPKYKHRYLLLDPEAFANALHIRSALAALDVQVAKLKPGVSDPGDLCSLREIDHAELVR